MEALIFQTRLADSLRSHRNNTAIEYGERKVLYKELESESRRVSRWIRHKGIDRGSFIGIYLEDKVDLITIMMGILMAGCVFVPLDTLLPVKRIHHMIRAAHVKIVFADARNKNRLLNFNEDIEKKDGIVFIDIADICDSSAGDEELFIDCEDKIYIYFTSGSTGVPKAIVGKNKSLLHFIDWEIDTFRIEKNWRVSQLTAVGFDAFLRDVFVPLCAGAAVCIPGNREMVMIGDGLIDWIDRNGITLIHCVPALFRLFNTRQLTADHFSRLKYVLLSGERIIPHELKGWYEKFDERIQLVNLYGPTETTMIKTFYFIEPSDADRGEVPIGKPMKGARTIILDNNMRPCPKGTVGEIYIRTPYRTHGYYNNDELNRRRFVRNPFGSGADDVIYKTGDLGKVLPDGNMVWMGRIDRQVKISGNRIELEEIERLLVKHPGVKESAIIKKEIPGKPNNNGLLCGCITGVEKSPGQTQSRTLEEESLISQVKKYLSERLPDYMIPAKIIKIEKIPARPNGKVDYEALSALFTEETTDIIPPGNDVERKLLEFWSQMLGIERIGINNNFMELGGNSLDMMSLVSKVHREFAVKISMREMFDHPTIEMQARLIREADKEKYYSLQAVQEKEYYVLTSAQKRLYFLQQMMPESTAYNMPHMAILEGELQRERVEKTFRELIKRHESPRTSFDLVEGEPVQKIHDNVTFSIEYYDLASESTEVVGDRNPKGHRNLLCNIGIISWNKNKKLKESSTEVIRPFDLSKAPLLRVGLIRKEDNRHFLVVDMHHIVSDGVSHLILSRNFMDIYNGEQLPALEFQYKDFAEWQAHEERKNRIKQQEEYWLRTFAGVIPVLDIPTDYSRPTVQSVEGNALGFDIPQKEAAALKDLAAKQGTTLYVVLLGVFNVLLAKMSGQEDIVVGTPTAGRRHPDLEQVIGMFVNTLAMRNYPGSRKTFTRFLREVKENTLDAFENQDYPFEELVEQVAVNRDVSRNPLFDVMFVMQNMDVPFIEIAGLTLKPYDYEDRMSKFDLTLYSVEEDERLLFIFEYCTKLFNQETIERFISYFKKVISRVSINPDSKIADMEIIPGKEKKRLLYDFNNTEAKYPRDKTIQRIFEEQAARTPGHTAVISVEQLQMTYGELNKRSNRLAHLLRERGVGPDTIVGMMVERSLEMIVGILGILKAGGAYLPIDPDYPRERSDYMLLDSNASLLLTSEELSFVGKGKGTGCCTPATCNPHLSLAYIIYTSGTTGKPKGVMIEHRNVVRLMFNDKYMYDFSSTDIWTMFHSYCFDLSVWEMYGALLYGGQLVIIPKMAARDFREYLEILKEKQVTILNQTPSAFYQLMSLELEYSQKELNLRYIIFGGEALNPARLKKWKDRYPGTKLINMYGITETTVHVTFKELTGSDVQAEVSNIGKPIPTLSTYIMDKNSRLVPIGAAGELVVGGEGLSRGYLNRPALTGEKYKRNFYKPEERLYRSGDLAKLSGEGEMEYLGRIDDQVKIRGFRIELSEIKTRLCGYNKIKEAVVISKKDKNGDNYLCAYFVGSDGVEFKDSPGGTELREYLSRSLPDYMIPSFFIRVDSIPLTSNGKIDKRGLPQPEIKAAEGYTAPGSEIEKKLANIWKEVLAIGNDKIGIDSSFFELGGHSLKLILLVTRIHKEFDVKLSLKDVFLTPTIRALSTYIQKAAKTRFVSVTPVEEKEYYPLSSAQKRLYVIYKMDRENVSYNISKTVMLEGLLEVEKINEIFNRLIKRHESLRTSFAFTAGQPVQRIHHEVEFSIEYVDGEGKNANEIDEIVRNFIHPFDPGKAPLLRAGLIRAAGAGHVFMLDMHHIISDFISGELLLRDFIILYKGEELAPLKLQYKDYSQWQNEWGRGQEIKKQEAYWLSVFAGDVPVLNLPADHEKPPVKSFVGEHISFFIDRQLCGMLRDLTKKTSTTLYMVLLAVFNILLSKYARQEDIVVGSPVSGRNHADFQNIIGIFVNMLAIRNRPEGNKSFNQFIGEVKENTLKAFENENYQFDELVSKLGLARDTGENPLFEVVFNMLRIDDAAGVIENMKEDSHLQASPYKTGDYRTPFNLLLNGREMKDTLHMMLTYSTALFEKATIEKMADHYVEIIKQVVVNTRIKLADIKISHDLLTVKPVTVRNNEAVFNL